MVNGFFFGRLAFSAHLYIKSFCLVGTFFAYFSNIEWLYNRTLAIFFSKENATRSFLIMKSLMDKLTKGAKGLLNEEENIQINRQMV